MIDNAARSPRSAYKKEGVVIAGIAFPSARVALVIAGVVTMLALGCGDDGAAPISATLSTHEPSRGGPPALEVERGSEAQSASTSGESPRRHRSSLADAYVVSYYGFPDGALLGILGSGPPSEVADVLQAQADEYQRLLPDIDVVPAFHLIAAVAQPLPQADGSYLNRMDPAQIEEYLRVARERGFFVILDLQMGRSTVAKEINAIRRYLEEPDVHLALDPEFAMQRGEVPGEVIGSMDASQINEAQRMLDEIVREFNIPNKILVVHQFEASMVTNKANVADFAGVDLVFDADGVGGPPAKLVDYEDFIRIDRAEYGAIKLFYKEDSDLLDPDEIVALDPLPSLVIYQ